MKPIQLPYNRTTGIFILAFFLIPGLIGVYDFSFGDPAIASLKVEKALRLVQWFFLPALLAALQWMPIVRFKKMERVTKAAAVLKLPFLAFYLWAFAGVLLSLAFAGSLSIIHDAPEKRWGMLSIGLALSSGAFVLLNSNKVLFQGDYETAKQEKERIRRATTLGDFRYENDGFVYQDKKQTFQFLWREIEGIVAYKTDQYTYDIIHLSIKSGTSELDIHEDLDGWFVFKEKMQAHLKDINHHWEMEVMFPPFEQSATWVYNKGEELQKNSGAPVEG